MNGERKRTMRIKKPHWSTIVAIFACLFISVCVIYATTFNFTYDTATPQGSDDPAEADDRMREIKAAVQERENVDHYWPLTSTEVSDADAGEHRKILFHGPIASPGTVAANHGQLFIKDVNSKAEFHWIDEDENEIQLTSKGTRLANDAWFFARNAAGTDKLKVIKADTSNRIILNSGGGILRMTNANILTNDLDIAHKKYVDDQDATKEDTLVTQSTAGIFGTWTDKDSGGSVALAKNEVYKVGSGGFLIAQDIEPSSGSTGVFYVYSDGNNPPTTVRGMYKNTDGNTMNTITIPIRKDDYWKVTWEASVKLWWLPIGTGTCVKQ